MRGLIFVSFIMLLFFTAKFSIAATPSVKLYGKFHKYSISSVAHRNNSGFSLIIKKYLKGKIHKSQSKSILSVVGPNFCKFNEFVHINLPGDNICPSPVCYLSRAPPLAAEA